MWLTAESSNPHPSLNLLLFALILSAIIGADEKILFSSAGAFFLSTGNGILMKVGSKFCTSFLAAISIIILYLLRNN